MVSAAGLHLVAAASSGEAEEGQVMFLAGFVAGAGVVMIVWVLAGIKQDESNFNYCYCDLEGPEVRRHPDCPRHPGPL